MEKSAVSHSDSDQTNTAPALEVAKPTLQVTLWCDSFFGVVLSCVVFGVDVRSSRCQGHGLGRLQPAATDKFNFPRPLRDAAMPTRIVAVYELNV